MGEVSKFVRSRKSKHRPGTDVNADRFEIVDKDGTWLTPNQILALALYHLKKKPRLDGCGRAHRANEPPGDAVAKLLGVTVHETPVGFQIYWRF